MKPARKAISSGQQTLSPCRDSIASTNIEARSNDSCVPVSSQATPRPSISTRNALRSRYARLTSVISSSPRARRLDVGGDVDARRCRRNRARSRRSWTSAARLLFDVERHAIGVEMHDAVTLRILDVIGEHRRAGLAAPRRRAAAPAIHGRRRCCRRAPARPRSLPTNSRPMMNASASPSGAPAPRNRSAMPHWLPSPEQPAILRQVHRRRDDAGSRGCPASISVDDRVVDHRLVVDRQQLLADADRDRVQPRSRSAREHNSFHVRRSNYLDLELRTN